MDYVHNYIYIYVGNSRRIDIVVNGFTEFVRSIVYTSPNLDMTMFLVVGFVPIAIYV